MWYFNLVKGVLILELRKGENTRRERERERERTRGREGRRESER